ncbi:hypothetical protein RAZWK3B_13989 [Roseobacter sp. AzwK-3b]|nr:hypothetical protein RAZWK3B_13989 [Roseobacter sp. AzwK-3b]
MGSHSEHEPRATNPGHQLRLSDRDAMTFDDDLIACAQAVERGDPERFAATMAAPVLARPTLFAIYAFNIEVSRASWVTQESIIAEMRLQWWRDALAEIRDRGVVRRHEVVTPLAHVLDAEGATLLDRLVEMRRWDIYREPFEDMSHFRDYIDATSGHLMLAAARALGPVPREPVLQAGRALGIANWLRAVPALEKAGRIPLVEGTPEAVRALANEGLQALAKARAQRHDVPRAARPALLPLWLAGPVLSRAARDPGRVAEGRLDVAPMQARLALMGRALSGLW